jgi:hypothetical protein
MSHLQQGSDAVPPVSAGSRAVQNIAMRQLRCSAPAKSESILFCAPHDADPCYRRACVVLLAHNSENSILDHSVRNGVAVCGLGDPDQLSGLAAGRLGADRRSEEELGKNSYFSNDPQIEIEHF